MVTSQITPPCHAYEVTYFQVLLHNFPFLAISTHGICVTTFSPTLCYYYNKVPMCTTTEIYMGIVKCYIWELSSVTNACQFSRYVNAIFV